MAWWKIEGKSGQIDWDAKPGLINAIPGQDTPENYYNGDRPADIMGNFLAIILRKFHYLTLEEIKAFILHETVPERCKRLVDDLNSIRIDSWNRITREYQECWNRPPYEEEKEAIVNFCTSYLE